MWELTTSMVRVAYRSYDEFYGFYISSEYFGYTLIPGD
jgi:hypothetical protein